MSAETIQEQIRILKEYKETTDVGEEVKAINEEIQRLEDFENGMGEENVPGQKSST